MTNTIPGSLPTGHAGEGRYPRISAIARHAGEYVSPVPDQVRYDGSGAAYTSGPEWPAGVAESAGLEANLRRQQGYAFVLHFQASLQFVVAGGQ